jgi:hypothetical protein
MTAVEAPLAGRARVRLALRGMPGRGPILGIAAAVALACALRIALGSGQVNYDSLYALVWGRDLAHGHLPDYAANVLPPTPHPLSTIAGILLAPLGAHATTGLFVASYLTLGAVGVLAFELGRHLAGVLGGVVAAALTLTRDVTLFNGALAYFDVAYLALLLGALLVELRRPRAGAPVFVLLAIAGLWRQEAWVLAGVYAVYLMWSQRGERHGIAPLAWAAIGPVVWLTADLLVTGRPLYALTYTRGATATLGRDTGLTAALVHLPRTLGQMVRPSLAVGALAGFALALLVIRARALPALAMLVISGAAIAAEVAVGTPGNPRYLLVPATLCVLLATLALTGWRELPAGAPARRRWQAIAAVVALLVVVEAPSDLGRLRDMRDRVVIQHRTGEAALTAVARAGCRRPAVAAPHLVPLLALDRDQPAQQFAVTRLHPPSRGGYVVPRTQSTVVNFLLVHRVARPPAGAPIVGAAGDWRVYGPCS